MLNVVDAPGSRDAVLALADGRLFRGRAFGARVTKVGEVVFNTSMTGYQEIITDPSYAGQFVCLTVSEVGNVGCNPEDEESFRFGAEGLIVRSLSPVVSSWRGEQSLSDFMETRGMPGMTDVDTRALTRHLRTTGAMMGALSTEDIDAETLIEMARAAAPMDGQDLAHQVTTTETYPWEQGGWNRPLVEPFAHVVALDFGIKLTILRRLRGAGLRVTVVKSRASVDEILALHPDGVFLSNGPGDPSALPDVVEMIRELFRRRPKMPVFGICLGHQLMCLALGGGTYKLKFGHHGGNHPVRQEDTRAVEITVQNHGFAASLESLGGDATLTHLNLFDQTVAGLRMRARPVMGVQYHPEASPGPHDAEHLFEDFAELIRRSRCA